MRPKNRWLIALAAVAIHISIGSAYAFSVFKNPLADQLRWDATQIAFAFTLAIFFLGVSAAFFGRFVEKYGARKSASTAAILFSLGLVGAGLSIHFESLICFYLTYGWIGGMGLGIGYISPVSTLVKWFPDRRGLATGMAVMGFGAGALICSPIAARLIEAVGIANTFYILGVTYFIIMLSGALYIARPEEGWMPAAMKEKLANGSLHIKQDLSQMTANEAVKTKRFWLLWLMMFVNISAGIMLISVASPMAQEKVGMAALAAASMVGIMGFFNGAGRIGWASLSDYWGRPNVFIIFFAVQVAAFLILPMTTNAIVFQILIYMILTIYGGGFASLPAFIGDLFGTKQLGAIHGYLLTSWSAAGIAGPMIVAYIRELTGNYDVTFYVFSILLAIALLAALAVRLDINRLSANDAQVISDDRPIYE